MILFPIDDNEISVFMDILLEAEASYKTNGNKLIQQAMNEADQAKAAEEAAREYRKAHMSKQLISRLALMQNPETLRKALTGTTSGNP